MEHQLFPESTKLPQIVCLKSRQDNNSSQTSLPFYCPVICLELNVDYIHCSQLLIVCEWTQKNGDLEMHPLSLFSNSGHQWLSTQISPGVTDKREISAGKGTRELQAFWCLWVCVPACLELDGTISSDLLTILILRHDLNDYPPERL